MIDIAHGQTGFTYLGVLVAIAMMGLVLAGAGEAWRTAAVREREAELLFVGDQYRAAIDSYVKASPGAPEYPRSVEDLLEDRRKAVTLRHLRRPFFDPLTGKRDWELLRSGDRINGVASRHEGAPFKRSGFPARYEGFEDAASYREWRFVSVGDAPATRVPGTVAAAGTPAPGGPASPRADDAPVPVVVVNPPPPRPDADPRCDDQRITDLRRCADAGDGLPVSATAACVASAAARHAACRRRQSIPPLRLPGVP